VRCQDLETFGEMLRERSFVRCQDLGDLRWVEMDFHIEIRQVDRSMSGQVEQINVRTGRVDKK
jgi:hypothetical protein